MSWEEVAIEDIAQVKGGKRLPAGHDFSPLPTDYPYIRARDIRNGKIEISEPVFLQENTQNILKRYTVQEGDVVVTIVGANVGDIGYVDGNLAGANLTENAAKLVVDRSRYDPYFLKSYLATETSKRRLAFIASGAAQGKLGLYKIKGFKVPCPPIKQQGRIVDLVRNYDNLIENNRRRIELLEEAARQLYKEWFVRFRFPGHEHVKIIDGVPEGWERKTIDALCTVGRGASPRPIKDYLEGDVPWFKIGDATASETPFIFQTAEKVIEAGAKKSVRLPEGELILSNSATCGVPNFTGVSGCIHDGWLYFKELKQVDKWFFYLYLVFQQRALLQGIGEGATQKNLNTTYVGRQEINLPVSSSLLSIFEEQVSPLFQGILNLAKQNNELRRARDLLLPKLMSGEITV